MESPKHKTLLIEMPINVFAIFKQTTDEFARSMRLASAIKWYERGMVSQEKAAEIAGLCREEFLLAMSQYEVSPFQYCAEEVLREAGYEG